MSESIVNFTIGTPVLKNVGMAVEITMLYLVYKLF